MSDKQSNPDEGELPAGDHPFRIYLNQEDQGDQGDQGPERYSFRETVAEGGMGVILSVYDHSLKRELAMKMVKTVKAVGKATVEKTQTDSQSRTTEHSRFLEEAHVTAQLDHPGILPVHELGFYSEDQAYFTMPLVKGKSLSEIFRLANAEKESWNLSRAVGVLIKVCQAVAYAHSKGIIHRDLKPANVMVGRFGEVYVLDWGLAKVQGKKDRHDLRLRLKRVPKPAPAETTANQTAQIVSDSSLVTMDGTVMGTPAYMSPEQATGRVDEVDQASDIYSLGAMLYELLARRGPYLRAEGKVSPQMVVARVVEGPPRAIHQINAKAPQELVAICNKAMAREKDKRYPSSFEMAEDLQAYLDNRVVRAYETGTFAAFKKWSYRHRTLLKSVGAVTILLALSAVAIFWFKGIIEAESWVLKGRQEFDQYRTLRDEIPKLKQAWNAAVPVVETWTPAWYRQQEIQAYKAFQDARKQLETHFDNAVFAFSNAIEVAPPSKIRDAARERLHETYMDRYVDLLKGYTVVQLPEFYKRRIRKLGGSRAEEVNKPGHVLLQTQPTGAEVYCFRYEENEEEYLSPLPFDPREGAKGEIVGEPFLRIKKIRDQQKNQSLFAAGDRLLRVRGNSISSRGDLARALASVHPDERVEVLVQRHGNEVKLIWTPFPRALYEEGTSSWESGLVMDIAAQFGMTFEGYPLDFVDECRVGNTKKDAPLKIELRQGSYLLVLRRNGYRDTRFPIVIPWWREEVESVRLLKEKEIPSGFVYVPAGPFSCGGDREAFESLERRDTPIGGFLMSRLEVTVAEYLEFLNDTKVGVDDDGNAEPRTAYVKRELERLSRTKIRLILSKGRGLREAEKYLARKNGTWTISDERGRLKMTSPALAASQFAAIEYAHWRTLKDGNTWTYRLPKELEWEKAARGVDRRIYVWGGYLVWPFCWSLSGKKPPILVPSTVGMHPIDESVYGVRDLAGSISEVTANRSYPGSEERFICRRGGDWTNSDAENFRVANRNGRLPWGRGVDAGFRLVGDLPPVGETD